MEIIKIDTAGEQDLSSASLPGLSLRLLDEPAIKQGYCLVFFGDLFFIPIISV